MIDRRECGGRRLTGQRLTGAHSLKWLPPHRSHALTTFSSRAPAVHRPFGLFSAAADLLVPAQVAHPRAPDPRAARTDRASRESVEAGAVTLRLCLHCGRHYHSGTGVRDRCGDCTGGGRGRRAQGSHTPQLAIGEKHRNTMKSIRLSLRENTPPVASLLAREARERPSYETIAPLRC